MKAHDAVEKHAHSAHWQPFFERKAQQSQGEKSKDGNNQNASVADLQEEKACKQEIPDGFDEQRPRTHYQIF